MSDRGARALTSDEIRTTLLLLETARNRAIFATLLYTGPRISEGLALDVPDVRWPGAELRIRSEIVYRKRVTKGHQVSRAIPVHADLAAVLYMYLLEENRTGGPLFLSMQSPSRLDRHSAWRVLNAAFTAAHMDRCSPHSLRKTFAQRLYDGGTDIYSIMHLMGHADIETTLGYLELRTERLAGAVRGLPDAGIRHELQPDAPDEPADAATDAPV